MGQSLVQWMLKATSNAWMSTPEMDRIGWLLSFKPTRILAHQILENVENLWMVVALKHIVETCF